MSQPRHDFWETPDPRSAVRKRMGSNEGMRAVLISIFLQSAGGVFLSGAATLLVVADTKVQAALVSVQGMAILGWIIAIAIMLFERFTGVDQRRPKRMHDGRRPNASGRGTVCGALTFSLGFSDLLGFTGNRP